MKRNSPLYAAALLLLFGAPASADTVLGAAEYTITIESAATDPCEEGPLGTVCRDGAVYVGDTVAGARMFMAPANEPGTYRLKAFDTVTNGVNTSDGLLNTVIMASDAAAHPAAQACLSRGAGWYLPSREELETIRSNAFLLPSFGSVWASGRQGDLNDQSVSSSASVSMWGRTNPLNVRCVRVGSGAAGAVASLPIPSVPSALPDTIVTSAAAYPRLLRTTTPVPVSVSGDGDPVISVAGGAFAASGTIRAGETVAVRLRSATEVGTTRTVNVQIAGQYFPFSVTTRADCRDGPIGSICADGTIYVADDANGERIYLAAQEEVGTHQWKTSNSASTPGSDVSGYRTTLSLLSSTGSASAHTAAAVCIRRGPGWFLPSHDDAVRILSNIAILPPEANINTTLYWGADQFSETQARLINFGVASDSATSKTASLPVRCARLDMRDPPQPPLPFNIAGVTLAERNVTVVSSDVFVLGMRSVTPSVIAVSGEGDPEVSVAGGPFGATGTILDGQTFVVRMQSAPGFAETRTATVTIGGVSSEFTVTTAANCETGLPGTLCSDGTIYAGLTGTGARFYLRTSNLTSSFQWKTGATLTAGASSQTDGFSNTGFMMVEAASHPAASACTALGPGWFLPAETELSTAFTNLSGVSAAGLTNVIHATSTQVDATLYRTINLSTGALDTRTKTSSSGIRCARLGDTGDPGMPQIGPFASLPSVPPLTTLTSDASPVRGLTTRLPVPVSVSGPGGAQISINGGDFVTSGQVRIGDVIRVRLQSPPDLGETRTATVTVGSTSATFSVTTGSCESETAPLGSICEDGAIYAGNTRDGTVRFYLSASESPFVTWKTDTTATAGTTSLSDGLANTLAMMGQASLHPAASACAALGPGWFLPSQAELVTAGANLAALPHVGLRNANHMSSTEVNASTYRIVNPVTGALSSNTKNITSSIAVRCARLGDEGDPGVPSISFANFDLAPADTIINVTSSLLSGLRTRAPVPVSVSGDGDPQISIEGAPFAGSGSARVGERMTIRLRSAPETGVTRTATVRIGSVDFPVSVTTADCESGPVGSVCADGAVYAGMSGTYRMYIAPEDQPELLRWKTSGSQTFGTTSTTDGFTNTAVMMKEPLLHPAASSCRARGDGWYLPSSGELATISGNAQTLSASFSFIGTGFSSGSYWSSSEVAAGTATRRPMGGSAASSSKTLTSPVRCVRVGPDAVAAVPSPFTFGSLTRPFDTLVTSSPVVIGGLRDLTPREITVSGGGSPEFSIEGGPFVTSGTISAGQSVVVRVRTPQTVGASNVATITIDGVSGTFTATAGQDCRVTTTRGTICEDGSIYIGLNSLSARLYVAPELELNTMPLKSAATTTPGTDGALGFSNTAAMVKSGESHPAVAACRLRGNQWYLPSSTEWGVMRSAVSSATIPGFTATSTLTWTSTEDVANRGQAILGVLNSSTLTPASKLGNFRVLCFRAEPGANIGTPTLGNFASLTYQSRGGLSVSNEIVLTGVITDTFSLPVTVSGDGDPMISVNGGEYATAGDLFVGDRLAVRVTSPVEDWTSRTVTVTVGALQRTFTVTSDGDCEGEGAPIGAPCADETVYAGANGVGERFYVARTPEPSTYRLRSNTGVPVVPVSADGFWNTSNMVGVSGGAGYDAALRCRSRGAEWYLPTATEVLSLVNRRSSFSGRVTYPAVETKFWTSQISSNGTGTAQSMFGTTTYSGVSSTEQNAVHCVRLGLFTTAPQPPAPFTITGVSFAIPDRLVTSESVVIRGTGSLTPTAISVTGDGSPEISVDGGEFAQSGMIAERQSFRVRLRSSVVREETRVATVTINGVSATFSVRTSPACDVGLQLGATCDDGAIFAGVNADGYRFYLAPEDEPSTLQWKDSRTSTIGSNSASDGFLNTAVMVRSTGSHPAAAACRARGDEWYLPSSGEMGTIYQSRLSLGHAGLQNAFYWSSTETAANAASAHTPLSSAGGSATFKDSFQRVRCVRTGLNEPLVAPNAFSIPGASGAPGAPVTSAEILPSGLRSFAPVDVFVSGNGDPEFSIDGGPFVIAGQLIAGQSVRLRVNAPVADWSSDTVTLTFDAGTSVRSGTFTVSSTGSCEHPSAPLGAVCQDGALFAGVNTDGHRFYLAPTNETTNRAWKTVANSTPSTASASDGFMNTAVMAKAAAAASHPAAAACRARGPEWYLPSSGELGVVYTNRGSLGGAGLTSTSHWTSTESAAMTALIRNPLSSTSTSTSNKTTALAVRCVRTNIDQSPVTPAPFTIAGAIGAPGAAVTSVAIIPTGFRSLAPVDVSVSGNGSPSFSIEGGPFVTSGQLIAGQTVQVRANAPVADWSSDTVTLTLNASGAARSGTFTVSSTGACEHPSATVGTVCADGARYAGLNAAGQRFYVAGAVESTTWRWKTTTTSTTGATSANNGRANTDAMITAGIALHPAAQACVNRGSAWYLPSPDELARLSTVRSLGVSPFPVSGSTAFWSSQEASSTSGIQRRLDGTSTSLGSTSKTTSLRVLCVRN